MYNWEELSRSPASRRGFLGMMAAAGLGAAAVGLFDGAAALGATAGELTGGPADGDVQFASVPGANIDLKVLNFALTLEILEADLYRQALNVAAGRAIGSALGSNAGSYKRAVGNGGMPKQNADDLFQFLVQFTFVEAAHRDFLRAAIQAAGGTPVAPNPGGYRFPGGLPGNIRGIMLNILPLEETGVRAYLGAAPYLTQLSLIQTAGTIYSTEARHSGVISSELFMPSGPNKMPGDLQVIPNQPSENTLEYFLKPQTVLTRASAYFA